MTATPDNSTAPLAEAAHVPLRSHVRAMVVLGLATLAVELAAYFWAASAASRRDALLLALGVSTLWVCLLSGPAAAGGAGTLSALLRSATLCDASLVSLLVFWGLDVAGAGPHYLSFGSVIAIYCTLAAVAILGACSVGVARRPGSRYAMGVSCSLLLLLALATPLWVGGSLEAAATPETRQTVVRLAVYANPFYSVTSPLAEATHFVWHQSHAMYRITRIGDFAAPPPVPWYAASLYMGCLSGLCVAVRLIRKT